MLHSCFPPGLSCSAPLCCVPSLCVPPLCSYWSALLQKRGADVIPFDVRGTTKNCWSKVHRGGPEVLRHEAFKGDSESESRVLFTSVHVLILYCVVSYHVVLRCFVSCCVPLFRIMLCYIVLCCTLSLRSLYIECPHTLLRLSSHTTQHCTCLIIDSPYLSAVQAGIFSSAIPTRWSPWPLCASRTSL